MNSKLSILYKETLLNNIIPFWELHSLDQKNGGYFTCLDPQGAIMTLINLFGYKAGKHGLFLCSITK